jgi:hypothetical protein
MYAISLLCQSNITVETTNTIGARRPVWTALLLAVARQLLAAFLRRGVFPSRSRRCLSLSRTFAFSWSDSGRCVGLPTPVRPTGSLFSLYLPS